MSPRTMITAGLLAALAGSAQAETMLGVAAIDLQNSFYVRMKEAGDAAAADYGVKSSWQSAEGSLEKEVAIIENFINQKVSAILVDPIDKDGAGSGDQEGDRRGYPGHHHGQQGRGRQELLDALSRL